MPTMIVRQPDGKLAAFSSVTEDFTAWDMSETEAFEYCREDLDLGRSDSEAKVRAGVEDHMPHMIGRPGSGTDRWRYSIETMALNKDRATVVARLQEMGFGDQSLEGISFPSEDDAPSA